MKTSLRPLMLSLVLIVTMFAFSPKAGASSQIAAPLAECREEIKTYCSDKIMGPELFRCLIVHQDKSSDMCKQVVQRITQANRQSSGLGAFGGGMGGGGGMFPTPVPFITYGGTLSPEKTPVSIEQHRYGIAVPVYRSEKDSAAASITGGNLRFGQPLVLDTGIVVPQEFQKLEIGGSFMRRLEGEKMLLGRLTIGAASDKLFLNPDDTTYTATGFYGYPIEGGNYWAWTVYMSNNSPIVNFIPIPGFVYILRKEKLTGMFGIPLASIQWTPIDPWIFSFSIFGVSLTTEAIYKHTDEVQYLTGLSWTQSSFIRADRLERKDRIFLDEKKLYVGIKTPIVDKLTGDLQFGESFDRSVYEGKRFNDREHGNIGLGNSWFAQWNFKYVFK